MTTDQLTLNYNYTRPQYYGILWDHMGYCGIMWDPVGFKKLEGEKMSFVQSGPS
jgi:hypothetical protein